MKHTKDKGFTLIELLVAMAIASIVMGAVVSTYQLQVLGKNTQEVLTDMNQGARAALEIMNNEIRSAGCDPAETAGAGIVIAAGNQLSFTKDSGNTAGGSFSPDGLLDGPNEQIRYALYVDGGGNQNLGRDTGGGLQPLARNIDALDFQYLDGNGNITGVLANIRSVQVTIVARSGANPGGFTHRYVDTRIYTNLQGNVLLPAQNDAFRRLLLTSTINLLNLW